MSAKYVNHFSLGGGQMRTTVRLEDYPINVAATAAGVALGMGVKIFGFNDDLAYVAAADIVTVTGAGITLNLTSEGGLNIADTPDLGLGTVIGSGAVATLDGTATFENILTGQTMNDMNGTNEHAYIMLASPLALVGTADCYLNAADTWTAIDAIGGITATGSVVVDWMVHTA